MRSSLLNEELVRILWRTLKFSRLAKKHKISCLPSFVSLERVQCDVKLTTTSMPKDWHSLVRNQELLIAKGNVIFAALLDALEELKKHKIVIRGIHPSNIVFSEDYSLVMFARVENACIELEKDEVKNQQPSPYNTDADFFLEEYPLTHHHRDVFAVGLLLLEILVGPEVLAVNQRDVDLCDLWKMIQVYLDKKTKALISGMIGLTAIPDIAEYKASILDQDEKHVASLIRAFQHVYVDNKFLGDMHANAKTKWARDQTQ